MDEIGLALAEGLDSESYRCSSEGIIVTDSSDGGTFFWRTPDGVMVFEQWFKGRYGVKLSAAGRLTRRPEYTRVACSPAMIRLFGKAASGGSRSLAFEKFWGELLKEFRNSSDVATRVLERWVDAGVVDVGFQVACTECGQRNWFAMNDLAKRLQCHRCLDDFPYPVSHPSKAVTTGERGSQFHRW